VHEYRKENNEKEESQRAYRITAGSLLMNKLREGESV